MLKYVDDINVYIQKLAKGTRFVNGKLQWTEEWRYEDIKTGMSMDRLTMKVFEAAVNSHYKCLQFILDIPEDHHDKKVPMLDTAC